MRASVQKCLGNGLSSTHTRRSRLMLRAVDATIQGRRLTLVDLARSWPHAERIRAPLKAVDRLLCNHHLHAERVTIYAAMTYRLTRSKRLVIVIDWSNLKSDCSWDLVRAAIPVGGRILRILDMVLPAGQQGSPKAEKQFLRRLSEVLPDDARPILVTDAGFRGPWFRAVGAMGWQWLGRLRNTTYLKPAEVPNVPGEWVSCKTMCAMATRNPHDLGSMGVARSNPLTARVVLHAKPAEVAITTIGKAHQRAIPTVATTHNARANHGYWWRRLR